MKGTRWKTVLRECAGMIHRELRVSLARIPRSKKWLFVVGCYNSGTTLLGKVLGSHPSISGLPTEGQYLTDQWPADHELGLSRMWVRREDLYRLTEADVGPDPVRLTKEWSACLDTRKPVLLEQSPPNSARTRWLQDHFENAHFVGIIRNGYAVAEGIRRKARPALTLRWTLEECAYQWARANEVLELDAEHLDRFMWVRYEEFTRDPEASLRAILEFIGLSAHVEWDLSRDWDVHERREPIRNLNAESISRLSGDEIRRINETIGEALVHFGYELLESGPAPAE